MAYSTASRRETSRYFPETGCLVEGIFLDFFDQHGVEMCGLPLTNRVWEQGIPTQYFQRLALEEVAPGQVRLKAVGSELLRLRQEQPAQPQPPPSFGPSRVLETPPFELINQLGRLPQHASLRYASRPLEHIRHLIIHHTGIPASVGPEVIAGYHVTDLNWPGIGYHLMVDGLGRVHQTNPLTLATYHARQFNGSSVGITLLGNFAHATPPAAQLDAIAHVCAWLIAGLGLALDAVKGHRELIAVTCPGEHWLQGPAWKYSLFARIERVMRGEPVEEPVAVSTPAARPAAWLWERPAPPTVTPLAAPPTWEPPTSPVTSEEPAPAALTDKADSLPQADENLPVALASDAVATPPMPSITEPRPWWLPVTSPAQPSDEAVSDLPEPPPATETVAPEPPQALDRITHEPPAAADTAWVSDQTMTWPPADDAGLAHASAPDVTAADITPQSEPEPDPASPPMPPTDDDHIPFYPRRRADH